MFGIVDDILLVGYDGNGTGYENILYRVLQIYSKEKLKLNNSKCHSRCSTVPFFSEIISRKDI